MEKSWPFERHFWQIDLRSRIAVDDEAERKVTGDDLRRLRELREGSLAVRRGG